MGQKKTDGKAVDVVIPGATAVTFGDLIRVDGWTGFAMKTMGASDTDRNMSIEVSAESIWYTAVAAAVNGARGTLVYWTAGTGFKKASADLTTTVVGGPVGIVEEARDAGGVAALRAFNGANLVV